MTPHARARLFAALATLLGPFVLSDGSATRAPEARSTVAPAPVEQEACAFADASPIVLSVSAPAESPPPRPITAAAGVDHSDLPGSQPFRTLHPARGPPGIS